LSLSVFIIIAAYIINT